MKCPNCGSETPGGVTYCSDFCREAGQAVEEIERNYPEVFKQSAKEQDYQDWKHARGRYAKN